MRTASIQPKNGLKIVRSLNVGVAQLTLQELFLIVSVYSILFKIPLDRKISSGRHSPHQDFRHTFLFRYINNLMYIVLNLVELF